jgi:hypothetical protein
MDQAKALFMGKPMTPESLPEVPPPGFPSAFVSENFVRFVGAQYFAPFKAYLDKAPSDVEQVLLFDIFPVPGAGLRPVAETRGWLDLLLADKVGAAQESKAILDFLAKTKETRWNKWFLRMLNADAHLFAGEKAAAITAAKDAMALLPCSVDAVRCLYPAVLGTQVLAWAGDKEGATALLEQLSLGVPGIAPGHAARDPIFTLPLDAQMAATAME